MSSENHQDKKLESAVHVAEPFAAVGGHIVEHNVDGGFYFNNKLKMGVGMLKFFNYHNQQPSHLSPWDKFQDSLINVGADELAIFMMSKVLGGTITLGVEIGDGVHNMLEHMPNYPRQLREAMEESITEYRKDPNYQPNFFKDTMIDSQLARLREREMEDEGIRLMAKGAHELKAFVTDTVKSIINNTIDFLYPKEAQTSEKTNQKAMEMMQDMGFVITDPVKVKEKLKDKNVVEFVYRMNDHLSKKGFIVKEIKERRAEARKIDLSHLSKEELVKKNAELLRPYNINPYDLDKETHIRLQQYQMYYQKKLQKEEIAKSTIMKYQIAHEGFGAIAELGAAINNPVINKIGQVGQGLATIYLNLSKLTGVFGPLQGLAAIHPVLTIATTIFSMIGLFNRKSDGLGKALQQMMQQLQTISSQVAALHRDLIAGINFLAAGQQRIYNDMLENFSHVVNLIQNEHRSLAIFLDQRLDQIDERLILLHQQLNSGIRALHLNEFEKLVFEFSEALHSSKLTDNDREEVIRKLKIDKLSDLEHWILNRSGSKELNGHSYTSIIVHSPVQNAESLLMNTMLFDGGNSQLSYFIAYLANTAKTIMGEEAKKILEKIKIEKLINPDIWLEGVTNYIELRQKFLEYDITYDRNGEVLSRIDVLAKEYQNFIQALQLNQHILFERLLAAHRHNIELLQNKAKEKYFDHVNGGLALTKREPIKSQIKFHYDESKVRHDVHDGQLKDLIVQNFDNYEQFMLEEVKSHHKKWQENIGKLLFALLGSSPTKEDFNDYFDRPAYPIARHRKNTAGGHSHLEVYHSFEHFSRFEDYDFQVPFSLTSLFDHDASLRTAIPKICYLAEALGLGHFEINVVAHYGNNNHVFTDQQHLVLNQYAAFYNYKYEFEITFVSDAGTKRTQLKLAEFDCHTDQIPVNEQITNAAKLNQKIRQRMVLVHGTPINTPVPVEYWWLGNINVKLNVFNQVKYFTKTNRLAKTVTKQQEANLEQELKPIIDAKIAELRGGYFQYFVDAEKRTGLQREFDNINISRNLILSFMYLLGFEQQYIDQVRSLFSSGSFSAYAHQQIENAGQQAQLQTGNIESGTIESQLLITAIGDVLVNADASAMQTLKNISASPDIQKSFAAYRLDNIMLALNRIDALRAMEKEPHHFPLPIITPSVTVVCESDGACTTQEIVEEESSAWPISGANAQQKPYSRPQTSSASIAMPFYIQPLQYLYDSVRDITSNIFFDSSSLVVREEPKETKSTEDLFQVPCQLGTLEEVSLLQCSGDGYTTYVFHKVPDTSAITEYKSQPTSHSPITGDNYEKSNCKAIEFYGKPAVYCEGENTTLVYQPQLPTPPLQNLDGQLMWLGIGFHLVKQAVSWFKNDKNNEAEAQPFTLSSNEYKTQQLEKFNCELNMVEKRLEQIDESLKKKELKRIVDGIDDCRFQIDMIKRKKAISIEELQEIYLDICYFRDNAFNDIKEIIISQNHSHQKTNITTSLKNHGFFSPAQLQPARHMSAPVVSYPLSPTVGLALNSTIK